jgi:diguanylate cyclase (GGDEF)-like protein
MWYRGGSAMTVLLAGLLAVTTALLVIQHRRYVAAQGRIASLEHERKLVVGLAGAVVGTDWLRSVQGLAGELVRAGVCRSAVLMAVADNGTLEVRAAAYGAGEAAWNPTLDESAHEALERAASVQAGDRLFQPLVEEGEVIGVLALRDSRASETVIDLSARLFTLGLEALRLSQKQATLSNTDGLTGLANHRHFQQTLGVALAQAYLENEPLGIILLDIDHFKSVNDTHGHLLGDLVLREIAYLLRRELPPDALPARYGGEEFVVLLRGQNALRAAEIAEQLRSAVAAHQIFDFASGTKLAVTVSLGVALYELGQGKNRFIARADEALYTSKREGRNRVTVAPPEADTNHLFRS